MQTHIKINVRQLLCAIAELFLLLSSVRSRSNYSKLLYTYNIGKESVGIAVAWCECVSSDELIGVQIEDD